MNSGLGELGWALAVLRRVCGERQTWRDLAIELAEPQAIIRETVPNERGSTIAVECIVPGAVFKLPGEAGGDPWPRLAYDLAALRLVESLARAGWRIVDEVIDETTYVVAEEPGGTIWAIGVSAPNDDIRAYLETDMALEERADRFAFVDPIDTRSPYDLMAALGVDDG